MSLITRRGAEQRAGHIMPPKQDKTLDSQCLTQLRESEGKGP